MRKSSQVVGRGGRTYRKGTVRRKTGSNTVMVQRMNGSPTGIAACSAPGACIVAAS